MADEPNNPSFSDLPVVNGTVPPSEHATGAKGYTPFAAGTKEFEDAKRRNEPRKELTVAQKAFRALEEEDSAEFDRLSKSLQHGFIVGGGTETQD